jgi:DNA-directed RNA polymerase subunit H (RpoH/RPB5)/nitrogen regulatory protein PII-like uncharacterized protein
MSFEYIDALYRSRMTLLNIMESRGFEVAKYRNISPKEIEAMSVAQNTLNMILPHKETAERAIHIIYALARMSRQKVMSTIADYIASLKLEEDTTASLDIILVMNDSIGEIHHKIALDFTVEKMTGIRSVSMYCIYNIINNPLTHVLVPPHRVVPPEEHAVLMKQLMLTSKGQLPMIKFHQDAIARCIGLVPGDIVQIDRPSASTGVYTTYRVCIP